MRPTIDQTLMSIAMNWEDRSTCDRNHVGVVIARDGRVIGSGYNGAPAGMPHCTHGMNFPSNRIIAASPNLMDKIMPPGSILPTTGYDRGCKLAIHAEANALAYAARHGVAVEGATVYTTLSPCYPCSQLMIAAGLARVVFNRSYRDPAGIDLLRNAGLTVDKI